QVVLGPLPTIEADATQMRQLLQNLMGNALKFRRPDIPPVVQVESAMLGSSDGDSEAEARGTWCQLTVADNGIGFDETYRERIFEVFQRLHNRSEYEGTGMGLAICRKIAESHRGTISAKGLPGQGATFIVNLPITQPKDEPHG